jgi:hypothetical protein
MIPSDSALRRAILTTGLPASNERPTCHYTGKPCEYEGSACTCLLPGFVGTPPTWPGEVRRAAALVQRLLDEARDRNPTLHLLAAGPGLDILLKFVAAHIDGAKEP